MPPARGSARRTGSVGSGRGCRGGLVARHGEVFSGIMGVMRVGIAYHYGWAVVVAASADYRVVDRRRIELIEPDLPVAPIHHEGGQHLLHRSGQPIDDHGLAELTTQVRASVLRVGSEALDNLERSLPAPIESIAIRAWPVDFPEDVAVLPRVPYESRADSVTWMDYSNL
jgi:hypothetical protein